MNAAEIRDLNDAREAAAFELVGRMSALLRMATRNEYGEVVITLGEVSLDGIVDNFNRATANDPISVDDVGR